MSGKDLSDSSKLLINGYIAKRLLPTGIIATLVGGVAGFLVNDWARSNAYSDALSTFATKMSDVSTDVGAAKGKVENASEDASRMNVKLAALLEKTEGQVEKLKEVLNTSETANVVARSLAADDGFKKLLSSALEKRALDLSQERQGMSEFKEGLRAELDEHKVRFNEEMVRTISEVTGKTAEARAIAVEARKEIQGFHESLVTLAVKPGVFKGSGRNEADVYNLSDESLPYKCQAESDRGAMFITRASPEPQQDALCICMNNKGSLGWTCFTR